jgi:hypothetical protein
MSDPSQQSRTEPQSSHRDITVENLYPELLCLIFSFLDTESKGRTAQVRNKTVKDSATGME